MLNFEYKGIDHAKKYVEGEIEALNNAEAAHKLKEKKIIITKLKEAKKKKEETKIENKHRILISSSKVTRTGWVKEKNRLDVEEKLKKYFNKQAAKICSLTENFKIIQQRIKVLELKEMSKLLSNEKVNVYRLEIDGEVICN